VRCRVSAHLLRSPSSTQAWVPAPSRRLWSRARFRSFASFRPGQGAELAMGPSWSRAAIPSGRARQPSSEAQEEQGRGE
jgi:hypothetical protein